MPYIVQNRREDIANGATPETPGELNYALTVAALNHLHNNAVSYSRIAEVISSFEDVKLELQLGDLIQEAPGELNDALRELSQNYFYSGFARAEVISSLECAKLEFYRRVAVPYEDQKILENGDVY